MVSYLALLATPGHWTGQLAGPDQLTVVTWWWEGGGGDRESLAPSRRIGNLPTNLHQLSTPFVPTVHKTNQPCLGRGGRSKEERWGREHYMRHTSDDVLPQKVISPTNLWEIPTKWQHWHTAEVQLSFLKYNCAYLIDVATLKLWGLLCFKYLLC